MTFHKDRAVANIIESHNTVKMINFLHGKYRHWI